MTKIYEIKGKDRCQINVNYCGVKIVAEFKQVSGGLRRSQLKTTDRFVQDALEHDPRFGSLYTCVQSFDDEELTREQIVEEEHRSAPAKRVYTVKTVNDAISYFSKKGELPTDDKSVKALMEQYNIAFPNLVWDAEGE